MKWILRWCWLTYCLQLWRMYQVHASDFVHQLSAPLAGAWAAYCQRSSASHACASVAGKSSAHRSARLRCGVCSTSAFGAGCARTYSCLPSARAGFALTTQQASYKCLLLIFPSKWPASARVAKYQRVAHVSSASPDLSPRERSLVPRCLKQGSTARPTRRRFGAALPAAKKRKGLF